MKNSATIKLYLLQYMRRVSILPNRFLGKLDLASFRKWNIFEYFSGLYMGRGHKSSESRVPNRLLTCKNVAKWQVYAFTSFVMYKWIFFSRMTFDKNHYCKFIITVYCFFVALPLTLKIYLTPLALCLCIF